MMLTKEQLQAGATAIDEYTDRVQMSFLRANPKAMNEPGIAGAFVVAGAIQAALLAMAVAAEKQEKSS